MEVEVVEAAGKPHPDKLGSNGRWADEVVNDGWVGEEDKEPTRDAARTASCPEQPVGSGWVVRAAVL